MEIVKWGESKIKTVKLREIDIRKVKYRRQRDVEKGQREIGRFISWC